jgi:hypothetical protein
MTHAHLEALQNKHSRLEEEIRVESQRPAARDQDIRRLKEEKLLLKEKIVEETRRIEEGQ